jgi:Ca2+-binding EF-hand superfamily protein
MMEVLISHEFGGHLLRKDPESTLLAAFRFMDDGKKGFLTREDVREKLLKYGEGDFTEGEVEELINYAVDPETDTIKYDDYAATLADE